MCPIFVHSYAIKPGYNQKSIFLDQIFGHQLHSVGCVSLCSKSVVILKKIVAIVPYLNPRSYSCKMLWNHLFFCKKYMYTYLVGCATLCSKIVVMLSTVEDCGNCRLSKSPVVFLRNWIAQAILPASKTYGFFRNDINAMHSMCVKEYETDPSL